MVGRAIKARGQVTLTKLYDGTNGTDGKNGSDGAVGAPGEDGKTTYVHVAYSSSADGNTDFSITDPSGRSYIGVLTDFTEKDSTNYLDYRWSLFKGQDGQNGENGAPGAPGADGKTTYVHIAYANSADGKTDFSTSDNSGKKYIGVLTDEVEKDSTDYTQYSWSLFKGQDGQNGENGAPGAPGADGKTTYVHIAYANSADGNTDFSTTENSGKKYIGVLTDEVEKDSTDYTQYTWSLFKGNDGQNGEDGAPGPKGADGRTSYVHVAYANSADGKTDFSTLDNSGKKYIGVLTDEVEKDSTDYTQYAWSLFKGQDGEDGADGTPGAPGADGRTPYVHFAYANSADGNTDFSTTVYSGKTYLGTLTDYTVADSTDPTKYTWSLIKGADGADGTPGKPGSDGKTPYIHFAYANSADGNTDFSTTVYSGKTYLGTLTDYIVADSTDPTKYTWSLIKGADGADGTPGKAGADGRTPYVHFAYANSADGNTDFSVTDYTNKKFIGTLTDYTVADSTDYTKYTWSLIKGADGADGTPGKAGADGRTPYVHFAYANSADGNTDFSVTDYTNKKFIGTLTDYVITDSTDYTKYTWSRLKGESGVGIANTVVEYQITDTQDQPSEDSGWTSSIPNLGTGSYLWTRTTFFYTDGTTSRAYTISKQSDNTYTAVLTNDSITLPSDSSGKVTDFSNSTGNFLVYDGTYQVDPTTVKVQLVQAVNVTVTLGGDAYTITAMDSSKNTGYFDLSYTYKGVALNKRVTVAKSKSGANGTTPVIVNLSANAQVFTFDSNNHANPAGQNILFKTTVSGTTATPVYKAIPYDNSGNAGAEIVMSNSGTNGKLLQVSQLNDYVSILVTASIGSVSDSTTIVRVKDGSSISPIPDPSNTVSSNTPPTDAKDGDWWNDTSQTPNVLKYRYRDKWVQYELDGYYVKANSISGEAIVTNTLEAQKIKYTNSNGTTTNLQTFDFSGMKTLLTDTKGNMYSNMESAVGSTKVVSSLQKKVNDLGQVNQLFNTEFSPDFQGWTAGSNSTDANPVTTEFTLIGTDGFGSNVVSHKGGGNWISSAPITVTAGMALSFSSRLSVPKTVTSGVPVALYIMAYNATNARVLSQGYNIPVNQLTATPTTFKIENIVMPSGAVKAFAVYAWNVSDEVYISQPMMVFSQTVGDYVQGNYNNNARVLAIEESANQFQVKISGDVKSAQNTADTANSAINSLSTGDRNYILDTANQKTQTSNGTDSQDFRDSAIFYSPIKNWGVANGDYIISFDWTLKTALSSDMQASLFFNQSPYQQQFFTIPAGQLTGHVDLKFKLWGSILTASSDVTGLTFRIMSQMASGNTITYSNLFMKSGTIITTWTPAPEDVQDVISQAVDNISVGGRNLLLGTSSIDFSSSIGTNGSTNMELLNYDNNVNMLHITAPINSGSYVGIFFPQNNSDRIQNGEKWSFSFDIKGTGDFTEVGVEGPGPWTHSSEIGEDWSRISSTNTANTGTNLVMYFDTNNKLLDVYIKLIKLEKGNIATDWTPAPEDVESGITSAQNSADTANKNAKSAQTSADTANQNLANASKSGIRYIRLRSEGNNDNASTHFSEIKVFNSSGTNVVKGKPALLVNGATNTQSASNATDESYSTYIDLGDMRNSEKYVMFDMGALRYDVNSVQISTWASTRTYYGVVAQTSSDGISWSTIYRGNITPNQLIGGVSSTVISFGMDTSTVLKLTADNYTLGIDANGNLISGITGNTQQVTLKGNVIHLDGNTVAGPDFFSLWNGKYGSTTIDSTGMEVRTGLSKTKFTNGNMQFITDLGENIGYIGRQVDSVHNNLDYLTFGLNGWHTTYPGDEHYDSTASNTDKYYGGDGILFGISNADGGYAPLLQWNSGLAASYKSSVSGWLFTQPIVGGIDIYGSDAASNKTVSMRFQNVSMSNGFTYPIMTSQQAAGSTGIVIGSGNTYMLGGNSFVWSVAGNGYAYYNTQKRGSSGSSLLMASDGAIIAQTSATKYKSDIEYEPSTSYGDKLLTIDPATWSDKNEKEQIQKYKDTGQEPEYSMNKDGARYYGLIAEDMVKAGLEDLIVRNTENGSVEGIQYEKIGIALIPLLREQRNQINELRVEIERLKEKNNE